MKGLRRPMCAAAERHITAPHQYEYFLTSRTRGENHAGFAGLEPDPECDTRHHICMGPRPRIEISKVEQKCPGESDSLSQRIINTHSKRNQERGIVSKMIRVNESDSSLQHQFCSVLGLGNVDPILSLTGKPNLIHVFCKAELQ